MSVPLTCRHPDGCPKPVLARGLCAAHYTRWRLTNDLGPAEIRRRMPGAVCAIPDCDRPVKGRGWCLNHYQLWRKHGDPNIHSKARAWLGITGADNPSWKGRNIGYAAAHVRVRTKQGPASTHSCAFCGEKAAEWSYDHADPNELVDQQTGFPYSADPDHYRPLCRSCHWKLDRSEA